MNWDDLSEFFAWKRQSPGESGIWDYLFNEFTLQDITATTSVFFPNLLERGGRVYLADGFTEDNYQHWLEKLGNTSDLQRLINHEHICYTLQQSDEHKDDKICYKRLLDVMEIGWRGTLQKHYPQYHFEVITHWQDEINPTIVFWQK